MSLLPPYYSLGFTTKNGKRSPIMPAQRLVDALLDFRRQVPAAKRDKKEEGKLVAAIRARMQPMANREKPVSTKTPTSVLLKLEARYANQQAKSKTQQFHPWVQRDATYLARVRSELKRRKSSNDSAKVQLARVQNAGTKRNSRPKLHDKMKPAVLRALKDEISAQRLASPQTHGSDEHAYYKKIVNILKRQRMKETAKRKQATAVIGKNPFVLSKFNLKPNLNVKGVAKPTTKQTVRTSTATQKPVDEVIEIQVKDAKTNIATFAKKYKMSLPVLRKLNPHLTIPADAVSGRSKKAGKKAVQFTKGSYVFVRRIPGMLSGVTTPERPTARRRKSGGRRNLFKLALDKGEAEQMGQPVAEYIEPELRPDTDYGMTKSQVQRLEDLVYGTDSQPAMPMGLTSLYNVLRQQGKQPTYEQISLWLKDQKLNQVFRQRMKQGYDVSPFTPIKPLVALSADLFTVTNAAQTAANKEKRRGGVIPEYWKGYGKRGYVLLVLDNYSRYVWARALPDKTPEVVARAMSEILEDDIRPLLKKLNRRVGYLQSDEGPEFQNVTSQMLRNFKQVKGKASIRQVYTKAGMPQANGLVERAVGIVRRLLAKYYTIKGGDKGGWRGLMPAVMSAYNNHYNESIKRTPAEALEQDTKDEFEELRSEVRASQVQRKNQPWKDYPLNALVRLRISDADGFNKSSKQSYYSNIYQIISKRKSNNTVTTQYRLRMPKDTEDHPYPDGTTAETKRVLAAQRNGKGGATTKLLSKEYPRNLLQLVTNVRGADKLKKGDNLRTG